MSITRMTLLAALATTLLMSAAPAGAATEIVNTLSLDAWFGGNEGPGNSVGTVVFTPGPATPPLGGGSVELTVDSTGRASFGTAAYKGTALSAINAIEYRAYVSSIGNPESPTLQFDIDYDGGDFNTSYQGRLVTYPTPPTTDTWVAVDALAGTWWATSAPGNTICSQATPCSWAQVLSNFPDAAIRNDPSQGGNLLFRLGGPITGGARVNIDDLTVQVGTATTTYDFEPGVSVNPSVAQAGTLVTIRAYGFKPQSTVKSFYYVPGTSGKRVLLCSATSSASGAFFCSVPLPTGALAGPAGVHGVLILGQRKVRYATEIVIAP